MAIPTAGIIGRLLQPLHRARQLQRSRGSVRTGFAILQRLGRLPVLRMIWHLCAIDYWRLPLGPSDNNARFSNLFQVRWATDEDLTALVDYYGDRARVTQRLARGHRCVVALSQQTIGAAVWLGIGPDQSEEDWEELRCLFQYPAQIVWSYDGKGTKMGAWGTMMKRLPSLLQQGGYEEIATIIDCNNWQSSDGHRSLGYERVGVLLHARLCGLGLRLFKPVGQRWQRVPAVLHQVAIRTQRD